MRFFIFSAILMILVGLRLWDFYETRKPEAGDTVVIDHTFLEEPRVVWDSQRFRAQNITVYAPAYPHFTYGDHISIRGTVEEESFTSSSGEEVTILVLKHPAIEKQHTMLHFSILSWVRERITTTFSTYLPHQESGLLLGIVFGIREEIDPAFYDKLSATGVLHVVAASGANVAMLASFVLSGLVVVISRKQALLVTGVLLVFYALLSGFDPSIVRATVMAILAFGAGLTGRQHWSLFALGLTAGVMLIVAPHLLTTVSFQLSVTATLGIITFKPILDYYFRLPRFFKEDVTTTIAAQIFTLPIILAVFSSYSLVSLPVNVLILWTIPLMMALGILASFLALAVSTLAAPILLLAYPLLLLFITIVEVFSFTAPVALPSIPPLMIVGFYVLFIAFILASKKRSKTAAVSSQ